MAFKNSREKIIADRKIIAAGYLFLVKLASGLEAKKVKIEVKIETMRSKLRSQGVKKGQIFPKSSYFLRNLQIISNTMQASKISK